MPVVDAQHCNQPAHPGAVAPAAPCGLLGWSFALVGLAAYAQVTPIDTAVADLLFAREGGTWALRHDPIVSGVFHQDGQAMMRMLWLACVAGAGVASVHAPWRHLRQPLARLALSVLLSVMVVSALKQLTAVHCPWDLLRYGGSARIADGGGSCFPSGHASAGYAWLALGFALPTSRGRRAGIAVAVALGVVFGAAQQLRGAHFLSHDLWAAAICWTVAVVTAAVWPPAPARCA